MSPAALVAFVLVSLMALKLRDIYCGGHYVCPACGATDEGRHSSKCPWGTRR